MPMGSGVPTGPRGGTHRARGSNIPIPQYHRYRVTHAGPYLRTCVRFPVQLCSGQLREICILIYRGSVSHRPVECISCNELEFTTEGFLNKLNEIAYELSHLPVQIGNPMHGRVPIPSPMASCCWQTGFPPCRCGSHLRRRVLVKNEPHVPEQGPQGPQDNQKLSGEECKIEY